MPCFSTLQAWRLADGGITFVERGDITYSMAIPCGQCIGCRLERSRQWAVRCMHEAKSHEFNCFITLTYDDKHLPTNNSLRYRDFQLFMRRLRRFTRVPIRFYMCGEYGSDFSRPHYHACLFGFSPSDLVFKGKTESGSSLYGSDILSKLWPDGFVSVGSFTFESAAYVARYIMKKVTGHQSDFHYSNVDFATGELVQRVPEFNKMSLKPGIGAIWFQKWYQDVFPHDRVIVNGHKAKPPKYYSKLYARKFPLEFEQIQFDREVSARLNTADNTDDRLAVRKICLEANINRFNRNLT